MQPSHGWTVLFLPISFEGPFRRMQTPDLAPSQRDEIEGGGRLQTHPAFLAAESYAAASPAAPHTGVR